jgi:hypothetical protein
MQLDDLTLPEDLLWMDEFDWTPVEQSQSYSITGALIIETGTKQAGRPITLSGGQDFGVIDRAALKLLSAKLSTNSPMVLTLNDQRVFNVIFNHTKNPIEAKPWIDYSTPDDADFYTLKISLIAV